MLFDEVECNLLHVVEMLARDVKHEQGMSKLSRSPLVLAALLELDRHEVGERLDRVLNAGQP